MALVTSKEMFKKAYEGGYEFGYECYGFGY